MPKRRTRTTDDNGKSLLEKLTGLLGKLAGLIAAIVTLLGGIVGVVHFIAPSAEQVEVITARTPTQVPLSLANSIGRDPGRQELYWFRMQLRNRTKENLPVAVRFEVKSGPAILEGESLYRFTVPASKESDRRPSPRLAFTNPDRPSSLEIRWSISQEPDIKISEDESIPPIRLLPRNVLDWELKTPEGQPLPREYYLAWLSAWVKTAKAFSKDQGLTPAWPEGTHPTLDTQVQQFIEAAYRKLFAGPEPIRVTPIPMQVPGNGQQEIQDAPAILRKRQADPLEAALLLAGVVEDVLAKMSVDLLLGAVPAQDPAAGKVLLLGWRVPGGVWKAIEPARASQLGFTENRTQTAEAAGRLSRSEQAIAAALQKNGVYFGTDSWVLNCRKAAGVYGISGLP